MTPPTPPIPPTPPTPPTETSSIPSPDERGVSAAQEAYLWDPGVTPDAEIAELERAAVTLRGGRPVDPAVRREARSVRIGLALATAAMLAIASGIVVWTWQAMRPQTIGGAGATWRLTLGAGARAGDVQIPKSKAYTSMREVTAGGRPLRIASGAGTSVELAPGSVAVVYEGSPGRPAIELRSGRAEVDVSAGDPAVLLDGMYGSVTAGPGTHARLGADEGTGRTLEVTAGTARVLAGKHEARLTRGGTTRISESGGDRLPRYDGETSAGAGAARAYLAMLSGKVDPKAREATLESMLRQSSREDAATLWNVMQQLPREDAARVAERVAELVAPALVKKGGVDFGSAEAREELWRRIVEDRAG